MKITRLLLISLILLPCLAFSTGIFNQVPNKQLPIDSAINLSLHITNDKQILAYWKIKPNFMLYQNRIHIKATKESSAKIGGVFIPRNDSIKQLKIDGHPVFNYFATAYIPITNRGDGNLQLTIQYQACKGKDYCYPPTAKQADINLNTQTIRIHNIDATIMVQSLANSHIFKHSIIITLLAFLGLGLLLSFTPCVLPMLPILWKIINGQNHSFVSAILHGAVYTLSMAICFAILGIIAASIGHSLQAVFQNIWVISAFCIIILWLALAQFDLLNFKTPQQFDNFLQKITGHTKAGSYVAAMTMGTLSSIVISPCVSAPLIAILLYIANTGNIVLGGSSLFTLAIGMNIPLLVIALAGRKFLPKAGNWMNITKHISGFVLIALAIWLLSRVIPEAISMSLYAILALLLAAYCYRLDIKNTLYRPLKTIFAILFLLYGASLFVGASLGHDDPLKPFSSNVHIVKMQSIKNMQQLESALTTARQQHKAVIIDFYAQWCVACQIMDKTVFSQNSIKTALKPFVRLRVDLSRNDKESIAIMKHYNVFAPPSLVFYDTSGNELKQLQTFGDTTQKKVLNRIKLAVST